jgi:hypothetical protein
MSDIYDLRDLSAQLDELRAQDIIGLDVQEKEWLEALEALNEQFIVEFADGINDYCDIECILIANYYFENYARQLAEDIGAINSVNSGLDQTNWPANHIDWEAAAAQLKLDYTSVTFGGHEYLIRG